MEPDLAEFPCTNCTERVGAVHVECTKCDDLRLCLECFSCGAELGDHLRIHPYKIRVKRLLLFQIFLFFEIIFCKFLYLEHGREMYI